MKKKDFLLGFVLAQPVQLAFPGVGEVTSALRWRASVPEKRLVWSGLRPAVVHLSCALDILGCPFFSLGS